MKFKDLKFKSQEIGFGDEIFRARVDFPNGNGLSVVYGEYTYSGDGTYEIVPLYNDELFTVDSWGDQVAGYITPEQIDSILEHAENDSHEDFVKFLNEEI